MYNVEQINGIPSEVLSYSSFEYNQLVSHRQHHFFFIIPGNPGSAHFYQPFAEDLYQRVVEEHADQVVHVYCLSHANHHINSSFKRSNESRYLGLEDQIFHHLDYMEHAIKRFKKKYELLLADIHVYLVGHSIGAYIAIEVLNRSSLLRRLCSNAMLLMPFILWRNVPSHHKRTLLLGKYSAALLKPAAYGITKALEYLPSAIRQAVIGLPIQSNRGVSQLVLHDLTSARLAGNFRSMGIDEVGAISVLDDHVLRSLQSLVTDSISLLTLHTNDDVWAPESDFAEVLRATRSIPRRRCLVETVFEKDLTHAFVLDQNAVRVVTEIVVRHVVSSKTRLSRVAPAIKSSL